MHNNKLNETTRVELIKDDNGKKYILHIKITIYNSTKKKIN